MVFRLMRTAIAVLMTATPALAGVVMSSSRQHTAATRPEKETRTAAPQKIDSQILQQIYRKRGQAAEKQVPEGSTLVRIDDKGRALVDIRVKVSAESLNLVKRRGGSIVSSSPKYDSIIAHPGGVDRNRQESRGRRALPSRQHESGPAAAHDVRTDARPLDGRFDRGVWRRGDAGRGAVSWAVRPGQPGRDVQLRWAAPHLLSRQRYAVHGQPARIRQCFQI